MTNFVVGQTIQDSLYREGGWPEHRIDTGTAQPVRDQPRRLPLHKRPLVEQKIKEMLEVGVIQPSESPWSACPVLVTKPDGSVSRDCMRLYTGGEQFHICYSSTKDGDTCLCSTELCNGSTSIIRKLTCQNVIKSSTSLIACLCLIIMFKNYCQTVLTGQTCYLKYVNKNTRKNPRHVVS